MLEHKDGSFHLLTRFGRVGEDGKLACVLQSKEVALKNYYKTLRKKTNKGYTKIDMKLGDDNDAVEPQLKKVKTEFAKSELADSV